jgi:hypothetical protein
VEGALDAAQRLALRVESRRWVIAVGTAIALLGVMGILRFAHKEELRLFNLDGERNVPAAFSALLWLGVALLALLVGRASQGRPELAWKLLAVLTIVLAADELAEVHEHLQFYTGIDWQILYAPLGVTALVLWVVLGRWLRRTRAGLLPFVGAAACVAVAEVFEAFEINSRGDPRPGFRVMVVSEELLEMTAALLVGLSALAALRAVTSRPA